MTSTILYVHGFGSKFDARNDKVVALERLGRVVGVDVDYSAPLADVESKIREVIMSESVDLIVGTSMGGHMAARMGAKYGIPFVACNPAVNPSESLLNHVGTRTDYYGREYTLTESVVSEYEMFATNGCGLILLDKDDELFDSMVTAKLLDSHYDVRLFDGGSHRFEHMNEAIATIDAFMADAEIVYGLS